MSRASLRWLGATFTLTSVGSAGKMTGMKPSKPVLVCLAALVASALALPSSADPFGRATMTPDLLFLPVHGFRIDFGYAAITGVTSIRTGDKGDLRGPYLAITYGVADTAQLMIEGMATKTFTPDHGSGTSAVGDFTVWGKFLLGTAPGGGGYGVRFGAKMANTPSGKDFGTNQNDFFAHVFAGVDAGSWKLSAYGGIGILDRPLENAQDDLAMFGVMALRPLGRGTVRVEGEGFTQSHLYGDNWALHVVYELPVTHTLGVQFAGQASTGDLYGSSELRAGVTARF